MGGLLSFFAIIIWILIKNPAVATWFIIFADAFAAIPTITKAWKAPRTESLMIYVLGGIGNIIGLATLQVWSFETAGFSIYLVILGVVMSLAITHRALARRFGYSV